MQNIIPISPLLKNVSSSILLEEVKFAAHLSRGEMFDELIQKKIQELWKTMTKEVEGLQSSMVQKQSSMENLSQDVLER